MIRIEEVMNLVLGRGRGLFALAISAGIANALFFRKNLSRAMVRKLSWATPEFSDDLGIKGWV